VRFSKGVLEYCAVRGFQQGHRGKRGALNFVATVSTVQCENCHFDWKPGRNNRFPDGWGGAHPKSASRHADRITARKRVILSLAGFMFSIPLVWKCQAHDLELSKHVFQAGRGTLQSEDPLHRTREISRPYHHRH
jgi:hypothetical protein